MEGPILEPVPRPRPPFSLQVLPRHWWPEDQVPARSLAPSWIAMVTTEGELCEQQHSQEQCRWGKG